MLPLFELDSHPAPLVIMQAVEGDQLDLSIEPRYMGVIKRQVPTAFCIAGKADDPVFPGNPRPFKDQQLFRPMEFL